MNKIFIGICTYNRKDIIQLNAKSLLEVKDIDKCEIHIFDDCSNEYNINYLKKLYKTNDIHRNDTNLGADYNTRIMYEEFLKSNCDYLFNADSDLLFNTNIIKIMNNIIKSFNKDFIISLFNEEKHKIIGEKNNYYLKNNLGAAGCLISKKIVKKVVNNLPDKYDSNTLSIDNFFSNYLLNNNINLYCTKKSYVQHIGFTGQNSSILLFDYGSNFELDSITNGKALNYIIEDTFYRNNYKEEILNLSKKDKIGIRLAIKILIFSIKSRFRRRK